MLKLDSSKVDFDPEHPDTWEALELLGLGDNTGPYEAHDLSNRVNEHLSALELRRVLGEHASDLLGQLRVLKELSGALMQHTTVLDQTGLGSA
jgi:hypothetical protein